MDNQPMGGAPVQPSGPTSPVSGGGYGKKSLKKWIIIYLIAAVVIYGLIYYFAAGKKGYNYAPPTDQGTTQNPPATNPYGY